MNTRPGAAHAHRQLHQTIGRQGIEKTVNLFYDRIRTHPALGPYFEQVRDWDELKQRIGHFWWLDLGGERYREDVYNPHAVHRHLQIPPALVDDWLELFSNTLYACLDEEQATTWFERAKKMAEWVRTELEKRSEPEPDDRR